MYASSHLKVLHALLLLLPPEEADAFKVRYMDAMADDVDVFPESE